MPCTLPPPQRAPPDSGPPLLSSGPRVRPLLPVPGRMCGRDGETAPAAGTEPDNRGAGPVARRVASGEAPTAGSRWGAGPRPDRGRDAGSGRRLGTRRCRTAVGRDPASVAELDGAAPGAGTAPYGATAATAGRGRTAVGSRAARRDGSRRRPDDGGGGPSPQKPGALLPDRHPEHANHPPASGSELPKLRHRHPPASAHPDPTDSPPTAPEPRDRTRGPAERILTRNHHGRYMTDTDGRA